MGLIKPNEMHTHTNTYTYTHIFMYIKNKAILTVTAITISNHQINQQYKTTLTSVGCWIPYSTVADQTKGARGLSYYM